MSEINSAVDVMTHIHTLEAELAILKQFKTLASKHEAREITKRIVLMERYLKEWRELLDTAAQKDFLSPI